VNERAASEEWRYLRAAFAVVGCLALAETAGWLGYRAVHEGPTALELTERCLRREKLLETIPAADPIAATAGGGALLTRVGGDAVQVVIASSEEEAAALEAAYRRTGRRIDLRLDVRDRVLYVWEPVRRPSPTQRQTLYDCWYQ
jgi:hypothetical protein